MIATFGITNGLSCSACTFVAGGQVISSAGKWTLCPSEFWKTLHVHTVAKILNRLLLPRVRKELSRQHVLFVICRWHSRALRAQRAYLRTGFKLLQLAEETLYFGGSLLRVIISSEFLLISVCFQFLHIQRWSHHFLIKIRLWNLLLPRLYIRALHLLLVFFLYLLFHRLLLLLNIHHR